MMLTKIKRAFGCQKKQLSDRDIDIIKCQQYAAGADRQLTEILRVVWEYVEKADTQPAETMARNIFYALASRRQI